MELLSVIVPIYNSEKYIMRCLDSLKDQKYENIEVILVDDGSTDKSAQICKKYCSEDHRFRYYYQENGGRSSARNKGLKQATGKWIAFCDSDDWVSREYYKKMMEIAIKDHVECVMAGYTLTDGSRFWGEELPVHGNVISSKKLARSFWDYHEKDLLTGNWNKLYLRSRLNVLFDEKMVCGEDMQFNMRFLSQAEHIALVPCAGYYYYQEPTKGIKYSNNDAWQCEQYVASIRSFLESFLEVEEYSKKFNSFLFETVCRDAALLAKGKPVSEARKKILEFYDYPILNKSIVHDRPDIRSLKYRAVGFLLKRKMIGLMVLAIKVI